MMLYEMYQAQCDFMEPIRALARMTESALKYPGTELFGNPLIGMAGAANEMIARSGLNHTRPAFGIRSVEVCGANVAVREESVMSTPFATLLHFAKDAAPAQPRVLIVAALSGHFATLMRETVRTMLPDNDVYITDWHNARDVRLHDGSFGMDDYVEHIIRCLEFLGSGAHVVAVCQPCVPVLAAVAVMAESNNPAQPASMTLMAGPIDTRNSPNSVDAFATSKPIEWFEQNVIDRVPGRFRGAGRRVYPGFLQLTAFVAMNPDRHLRAHREMYEAIASNDLERASKLRAFYDEYFSVLDMPAEFYLETIRVVFQEQALARGTFEWRGRRVDPRAIEQTALFTVEGEKDDICGLGQTSAAHQLCSGLAPAQKSHHHQSGAGHFGVFNGSRWNSTIYPLVRDVISRNGNHGARAAGRGLVEFRAA